MAAERIAIVGGGLAGLAAAVALADEGAAVVVLEAKPTLGGRAGSFADPTLEETVDNCQHVGLGCCTNWLDFCQRIGAHDCLDAHRRFVYQEPSGVRSVLQASPLPAPFHLTPALLGLRFLSFGEKLRLGWATARLIFERRREMPFADWLKERGQTPRLVARFWEPILTSALNESLDRIALRYARQVVTEGFLAHRAAARMYVPRTPLGDIYERRLKAWLAARGAEIRTNAAVLGVEFAADGAAVLGCRTRTDFVAADHIVLATPPHRVRTLLGNAPSSLATIVEPLERFEYSPITSVHCWFDRPAMDVPALVPLDRTVQWLFRKPTEPPKQYLQAVISASRALDALGKERIAEKIVAEIREILPAARDAKLLHCRVVTERRATYSPTPQVDELRPAQATPVRNFWLAGDYTRTGWPATMEGAVRSGRLAAEGVLAALGRPKPALRPPLGAGGLVRWLLACG